MALDTNSLSNIITGLLSLGAGLFLGRGRRNAETDSVNIKNAGLSMDLFKTAYEEKVKMMADTCTQLKIEVRDLIEKNITQRQENDIYKNKIIELEIENGILRGKILILENKDI